MALLAWREDGRVRGAAMSMRHRLQCVKDLLVLLPLRHDNATPASRPLYTQSVGFDSMTTTLQRVAIGLLVSLLAALSLPAWAQPPSGAQARVLGTELRADNADDLRFLVLQKLTARYAADKRITVSQAEKDALVAQVRKAMRRAGAPPDDPADRAARDEVAAAFIRQWKINGALYRQYGGRILYQQGGPEPLDAYRLFLEAHQARGELVFADPAVEAAFWRYYQDDSKHSFYPRGSREEAQAFTVPPWRER
jgi:hypothetical protein